jgi:hypothetical protein
MRAPLTAVVAFLLSLAAVVGLVVYEADGLGEPCEIGCSAQAVRQPQTSAWSGAWKPLRLLGIVTLVRSLERPSLLPVPPAPVLSASWGAPPPTSNSILRI